jgi:hypothetical protein
MSGICPFDDTVDDAGTVVLYSDFELIFTDGLDVNPDFGQNPGFFTGIERVIDGFFDGGEQCFAWVIESEQMSVLREEFADGYFLLGLCHVLRGGSTFA